MEISNPDMKNNLKKFGVEDDDLNYRTAMVVRLMQRSIAEGDTASTRLLGELTGDLNRFGDYPEEEGLVELSYPTICIPSNGRDKRTDNVLAPQAGPQTLFMASEADIVIYGGAAGGGKTYALLLEGLRHKDVKGFGAVIFRHNFTQITAEGGLWDTSHKIYDQVAGAESRKSPKLHWRFTDKAKIHFAHISCEVDLKSWQGTQICYMGFDELTHFTRHQFLYMLSRNRSTCGVRPYIRATCNPDADSWVADFIKWWIDQDTGYPIKERSGQIRYMAVLNDTIYWGDTRDELVEKYNADSKDCKSVTFIASSLQDNRILMETDPGYMANLKAMTEVDRERLLNGNWKIKASAGKFFKRLQVNILPQAPDDIIAWCRAWDFAATDEDENGDADYTASVLMGKRQNGRYVILDVVNQQIKAGDVEKLLKNVSQIDKSKYGFLYTVRIPQDPGAAGKILAKQYINMLAGYNVICEPVSGSKELRATPLATQWQNGFVDIVEGEWNDTYLSQMESFPESKHDDMVDASSDSFNTLAGDTFNLDNLL